jgi:hypothetical protein
MLLTTHTLQQLRMSESAKTFIVRNGWLGSNIEHLISSQGDYRGIIRELYARNKNKRTKFEFTEFSDLPLMPEFESSSCEKVPRTPYQLIDTTSGLEFKVFFDKNGEVCFYDNEDGYAWTRRIGATGEIELNDGNGYTCCYKHDDRGNLISFRDKSDTSIRLTMEFNSENRLFRMTSNNKVILYVPKLNDRVKRELNSFVKGTSIRDDTKRIIPIWLRAVVLTTLVTTSVIALHHLNFI